MSRPKVVLIICAAAVIVAAAVVVPLDLMGHHHNDSAQTASSTTRAGKTTGSTTKSYTVRECTNSGCDVVEATRSTPSPVDFYGASCSGTSGPWFLNVTAGGPNGTPHPVYRLDWSFPKNQSSALPSGPATVPGYPITMTLNKGVLAIKGTAANGTPVSATGSLTVALGGTSSAPTLTIKETGLYLAEHLLAVVSPFDVGTNPAVLPIKRLAHFRGC